MGLAVEESTGLPSSRSTSTSPGSAVEVNRSVRHKNDLFTNFPPDLAPRFSLSGIDSGNWRSPVSSKPPFPNNLNNLGLNESFRSSSSNSSNYGGVSTRLNKPFAPNIPERENHTEKHYMEALMDKTNTFIQWPSRMKIGAKTKKDLFIRVYGHSPEEVNEAKNQILADLGPHRDLRITLKMEISYTDHSHLIGCRGQTIRRVMEDTGCHIHFPDSNRMSKEHKSNQVTIAGSSMEAVERARARVRELSPLIFQFSLPMVHSPYEMQMNPDAHHIFIENIQTTYNVQVTIHPPNKLQQTTVSVKGCEVDAAGVKEAVAKIVGYFSSGTVVSPAAVESTMEISAPQHSFVRAVNDSNVHAIMINTGAKIIFPDLSDSNIQQIKRSRVYITGDINCVYNARQQLIGCLPLRMIFDLSDDHQLDWDSVRIIGSDLNVNVKLINRNRNSGDRQGGLSSLPPPIPGRSRTIQLIAAERNTTNIFEARRMILGGSEPSFPANIPSTYHLRPAFNHANTFQYGNRLGPGSLPPLMLPTSPNMLSPVLSPSFWPPTPFSSPFCSPPIATCVMSNAGSNNGNNLGHNTSINNGPPPGLGKMTLTLNSSFGYASLPSPLNPPEININDMKQHFHLPLLDLHNQQHGGISSLNTPMSLGGTSTLSDLSPMSVNHPGVSMMNAIINDFAGMDLHRKAPGCERSNTMPNLMANISATPAESVGSPCPSPNPAEASVNPEEGAAGGISRDGMAEKINNPTNEKKYMAVKAMFNSKIGGNTRVPTSEWSGCGFSRTYMNLFPQENGGRNNGRPEASANEDGLSSVVSSWTSSSSTSESNGRNSPELSSDRNGTKEGSTMHKTHAPLGHQQSNLLDFSATRLNPDKPPTDLASLFIQNGLDKYIDTFVSEEIDLSAFSNLTEADLRSLGVSSYPARKRMLVLIAQLACPHPDQDWH